MNTFETKFPFVVNITEKDWYKVELWCQQYVGEFDIDWYKLGIDPISESNVTTWYFCREADALLFELRWG